MKNSIPRGFTLMELVTVVAILSVIALMAVARVDRVALSAKTAAAENDLKVIAVALTDTDGGYVADMRGIPGFNLSLLRLGNLFVSTNLYGAIGVDAAKPCGQRVDFDRRVVADAGTPVAAGVAKPSAFMFWNGESERGWHGPYVKHATGVFPTAKDRRFADDGTFAERGFFPPLDNNYLPEDYRSGYLGCSVYGFPGEPAFLDPWGNPYVLQVPPSQAFSDSPATVADEVRFRYARIVSAGPDGVLSTPCFSVNATNDVSATAWTRRTRRLARQAGRVDGDDVSARGDDLVRFLSRADVDEGEEAW